MSGTKKPSSSTLHDPEVDWLNLDKVGRAIWKYFERLSLGQVFWRVSAQDRLRLMPPCFADVSTPPHTPDRAQYRSDPDDYRSPYTRGRNISHRGVLVID